MYKYVPAVLNTGDNASLDVVATGSVAGFLLRSSAACDMWVELKDAGLYYTISNATGRVVAALSGAADLRAVYLETPIDVSGQLLRFRSSVLQASAVTVQLICIA